jgi:segregation and condensation protein B
MCQAFPIFAPAMEIARIIEALLFAAEGPLRTEQMIDLFREEEFEGLNLDLSLLEVILEGLAMKYESPDFVFELRQIDGGYQLYTKREYYPYLRHAALMKNQKKLSKASLETLSIIAYKQPVSKTEIEFIRGVSCDYAIRKLLDKSLIEIRGRSEAAGRPLQYGTTSFFMEYFGINTIKDLPRMDEVAVDEAEYQAQFKVFLSEREPAPGETPAIMHQEEE